MPDRGLKSLKPLGVKIAGSGRFLPEKVLDNRYFEQHLDTTDTWIRERTGILERRMASEGETTATMATAAARAAIDDAGMTVDDIDMILVATITPEAILPSTACFVQQALGIRPVPAFDLVAACSGFIYSLINAAFMLQTGHYRNILVIGSDTMTRITDFGDRATCILFGDAAGAVVLSATPDTNGSAIAHFKMSAEGSGDSLLFVPAGGSRLPSSHMTIDERLHYVKMNGREVYKRAVKRNLELVDSTLAEAGISPEEIALVIPHQSNLRIIESARQRLGLPKDRMFTNIQKCGNTSAASIPLGLDECLKTGRIKDGDMVLLIAFGAGFTWASALMKL
ncbi:MAG: ketoacyl-ACP synthase III [Phycisphaerales bacterium]|nr:ketoacyl-ACP synthase III [Phycisphaerales bacterium]